MPSVKTKIDGEYIKIPMYTSGDADSITYNSSATHPNGTVGKELKEQSEKIVNLEEAIEGVDDLIGSGVIE